MAFDPDLIKLVQILEQRPGLQQQVYLAAKIPNNWFAVRDVLRSSGIPAYVVNVDPPIGVAISVGTLAAIIGFSERQAAYAPLVAAAQAQTVISVAAGGADVPAPPGSATSWGGYALVALVLLAVVFVVGRRK